METNTAVMLPEALSIGLPEIDAQHESIFRCIESLKAICYGSGPASLEEFENLLEYLKYHFASEERLAGEVGVDFLDHATVHRKNLLALRRAFSEVQSGMRDLHSFLRYIEYWFERHITDEDKPFAATIHARQAAARDDSPTAGS
ncbi:MAG TPA: hemerythrin domain-containing protein [Accumulibacter sp.]|nr:hemerythrin domain-containing protein [Accumulibacter sp.]